MEGDRRKEEGLGREWNRNKIQSKPMLVHRPHRVNPSANTSTPPAPRTATFSSIITSDTLTTLTTSPLDLQSDSQNNNNNDALTKWTRKVLEHSSLFPPANLDDLPHLAHIDDVEIDPLPLNIQGELESTPSSVSEEEIENRHDWTELPIEIVHRICTWLPANDMMAWSQTNHHFHEFLQREEVFHFLLVRDFHFHEQTQGEQLDETEVRKIRYFQIESLVAGDSSCSYDEIEGMDHDDDVVDDDDGDVDHDDEERDGNDDQEEDEMIQVELDFGQLLPTRQHHYNQFWVQEKKVEVDEYPMEFWHDHPELFQKAMDRTLRVDVTRTKVNQVQQLLGSDLISHREGYVYLYCLLSGFDTQVRQTYAAYCRRKDTWMRYWHHQVFKYQPYEVFFRWIKILAPITFVLQSIIIMLEFDGIIEPDYLRNYSPWFAFWILSHLSNYFLIVRREYETFKPRYVFMYLITLSLYLSVAAGFVVFFFVVMILWAYW
eukprot:TRINITY_DN1338_c0_g1_i11.p1 TRINITY_DN1338_c0_g1~~TRINITY_DN1338_c0_g1_i11.p1  ORF type:complete len:489 (+),score=121.69 TRINITY_DN1338_c0_g1_i11:1418-2884(+)